MSLLYACWCWDYNLDTIFLTLGTSSVKKILNKDITDLFNKETFQCGVFKGKEMYPVVDWELCDQLALRTKVNRIVDRVKTLRKNNISKLNLFLQSSFSFPQKRSGKSPFKYLQEEEGKRVKEIEYNAMKVDKENRKLKRQIKQSNVNVDNLEIQIDHYAR